MCNDNALYKSFVTTLARELLDRARGLAPARARLAAFMDQGPHWASLRRRCYGGHQGLEKEPPQPNSSVLSARHGCGAT
jgi:hypothetical protein